MPGYTLVFQHPLVSLQCRTIIPSYCLEKLFQTLSSTVFILNRKFFLQIHKCSTSCHQYSKRSYLFMAIIILFFFPLLLYIYLLINLFFFFLSCLQATLFLGSFHRLLEHTWFFLLINIPSLDLMSLQPHNPIYFLSCKHSLNLTEGTVTMSHFFLNLAFLQNLSNCSEIAVIFAKTKIKYSHINNWKTFSPTDHLPSWTLHSPDSFQLFCLLFWFLFSPYHLFLSLQYPYSLRLCSVSSFLLSLCSII